MRAFKKKKYLCICLAIILMLSMFLSPFQAVYATEVGEETQETTTQTEPTVEPTSPTETVVEPTEKTTETVPTEPVTEPTQPVTEPTAPVDVEPTQPVVEETEQETTDPTEAPTEHVHDYVAGNIVKPDCINDGYTEYKCECGETYNDDKTEATGHSYVEGVCSACGEKDPNEPEIVKESVDYKVVITTQVLASDVFYINGAPTFIYKVDQLNEDGTVAKYWYKSVTIEKEYTELMTDENGYVSVDIEMSLPSGNYRITSEQTGRYKVDNKKQEFSLDFIEIAINPNDIADENEIKTTDEVTEGEDVEVVIKKTREEIIKETLEAVELEDKEIVFIFSKSDKKNLPMSSCVSNNGAAEYIGISLKANKTTFDADTKIQPDDFTLMLIKADGTTEEVDTSDMTFDFSTGENIYPGMTKFPDVDGDVKVSVSYAFEGVAYYTDITVNLYQIPYIVSLETELKVGKEDNGNADNYIVTANYSDGTKKLLLPAEVRAKDSIVLNSKDIDGFASYTFAGVSYISITFSDGASTSGVGEVLVINENMLHSELSSINLATDTVKIEWNGSSEWAMTITPVYVEKDVSGVPTYVMRNYNGVWKAVLS